MIESTSAQQKEASTTRSRPAFEQVAELVWSVPVECPFPVGFTFSYLLANSVGQFVVVDPGWSSPTGRSQLMAGIAQAGLDSKSMVGVVITHFHPDHLGAAFELADAHGAWLAMHPLESQFFADVGLDELIEREEAFLLSCGMPSETIDGVLLRPEHYSRMFPGVRRSNLEIHHGAAIPLAGRNVTVVWTPGHTAGHVCLLDHDSRVVLTGDHVLPRITPNIGVESNQPDRDALAEYFTSLEAIAAWDAWEVCPAHEYRFRGLAERCRDLRDHHLERGLEVRTALAVNPRATAWVIAKGLTWSRGWEGLDGENLRAAVAETRSHLNHIAANDRRKPDDPERPHASGGNTFRPTP